MRKIDYDNEHRCAEHGHEHEYERVVFRRTTLLHQVRPNQTKGDNATI
jgi:hypothetical protein